MQVAEVTPGAATKILSSERQVTRLGESVFRSGRIDPASINNVCVTLARMAQIYKKLEVGSLRVVATSAVRDASNQREFLDRTSLAIGAPVEIISGQEEARLIHLGVQSRWPHLKERLLMVDVGGGSAELILSEQGLMVEAFSKPLGAVRLTEVFLKNDPPLPEELHRMDKYIEEKLLAPLERIGNGPYDRVIATSATAAAIVCAINKVPRIRRDEADRLRASTAQVRQFYREICSAPLAGRRKIAGIGPRRAEIIIGGTAVFLRILEAFKQSSLSYSAAGVRDGIIADLVSRGRELSRLSREQRRLVEQMSRRYGVSLPHARKVASLAHDLFESLQPLHKLSPAFGKILEAAAYLHDSGHYVSDSGHHKHSYYLVANSDMPGFTDAERHLIAMLCRYHRKAMPAPRHTAFQILPLETRRALAFMVPLLRIADSLDRGHEQTIESVNGMARNGGVVITVQPKGDADLELWAAERVADSFREVYGLPVSLVKGKL